MSKVTPFCPMCKKHGKSEAEYTSHFMRESRDENSRPLCPILLDMKCNRCGNAGHIAARCPDKVCVFCNKNGHTVSYCTNAPKDVIDALRANNEILTKRNDSLKIVNTKLDAAIADINTQLVANEIKLAKTQSDLDKLKKQKNETTIRVNGLSANGVSNAFSDYLKDRTKSTNKH